MIPLAKDTRESVGAFAAKVENRSLLYEKMVLAKNWGHEVDRFSDANRFNVLRACTGGGALLGEDRDEANRKANSPRARDHVKKANRYKATVAGFLATVPADNSELIKAQIKNANQLLSLLERSYDGKVKRVRTLTAGLQGRLLINMGGGVMENAGIALDRCFGLPLIPGSAVKGITRNAALWEIRRTKEQSEKEKLLRIAMAAFGFTANDLKGSGDFAWAAESKELAMKIGTAISKEKVFRGFCSFLPAYPTSAENLAIVAECITPHPRAHGQKGKPMPLFFPAVENGSTFGFAIVVQRKLESIDTAETLDHALRWLTTAICDNGVGAKTGAGYGWFGIDPEAEERRRADMKKQVEEGAAKRARDKAAAEKARKEAEALAAMSPMDRTVHDLNEYDEQKRAEFAKSLAEKAPEEQQGFARWCAGDGKTYWNKWKKQKKWKDRLDPIREIAAKYGIKLS